jgi:hypothetical protein
MTTTAYDDQFAPEPDPVFEARAEFIRWVEQVLDTACVDDVLDKADTIRRVTLAHLHLRDTKADSDGDDGA